MKLKSAIRTTDFTEDTDFQKVMIFLKFTQ